MIYTSEAMRRMRTGGAIVTGWIIYFLSHFVPRSKRIWVFAGWHKNAERQIFSDNSKYLFLHVANTRNDVRAVWIGSDDKIVDILRTSGYESYSVHSLWGAFYSLRAGYTIIDALMQTEHWRYCGRSHVIQLWHADGLKTLHLGSTWSPKKYKEIIFSPGLFKKLHFCIASSPYIAEHFIGPSFEVPRQQIRITGLPRYDAFFEKIRGADIDLHTELKTKLDAVQASHPAKIIFYAPTFRRGRAASAQLDHLRLDEMNTFLVRNNFFLFVSLHPKFSASQWLQKNLSNLFFINPDFDKYPLLPRFDVVITDYSSMCLEFLLLDKPSIFYVYDFDEYRKAPGIPEEFWNLVPGPRVRTFEELLHALVAPDILAEERGRVRDILFTFEKGQSAELVTQSLLQEISGR